MMKSAEEIGIIDCEVKLKFANQETTPEKIISQVKSMKKKTINYGSAITFQTYEVKEKGKTVQRRKLNATGIISDDIHGRGIYFILSSDEKALLYVGKHNNLKQRLKEHLVECALNTYSHINKVYDYLENNKAKMLTYCVINAKESTGLAAVEEALINYICDNKGKDKFLSDCWNKRKD